MEMDGAFWIFRFSPYRPPAIYWQPAREINPCDKFLNFKYNCHNTKEIMASKRNRKPEDYSINELRQLIIDKKRKERSDRLSRYRRTGRSYHLETPPKENPFNEPVAEFDTETQHSPKKRGKLDHLLMAVEILAVLGLLFILFNGVNMLRNLNQEVSASLIQPTITPTALIQAVVLPSGHTPPTEPGGAQPNESEIPAHLRAYVQSLVDIPLPTPSPEQAIRIQIPAISVDAPVVMGDGFEQLKKGVGQYVGSSNPGKNGNVVLSAHNDIFGEIFRDLDKLQKGDEIIVFTNLRSYTYIVENQQVVEPTQVEVMAPTESPVVTLISCYPYLVDDQRIVVSGSLIEQ